MRSRKPHTGSQLVIKMGRASPLYLRQTTAIGQTQSCLSNLAAQGVLLRPAARSHLAGNAESFLPLRPTNVESSF